MRSRNIGWVMSTYLGCRHVPPAVVGVNCLASQHVNKLHQSESVDSEISDQLNQSRNKKNTIKIGQKTYVVKLENSPTRKKSSKTDRVHIIKDSVLHSLLNLPMFHAQKPFLAPADKITKGSQYVSETPSCVAFAKEMLSLKVISKKERSSILNHFVLPTDMMPESQDLISPVREYLQNGNSTLSIVNPGLEAYWESLKPVLNDLTNAQCFAEEAAHPLLRYAQGFECIANYKGEPSIISIKKISNRDHKKKHKLELVAGAAAFNFDPRWPVQVKSFVLILAKSDGSPAVVNVLNRENSLALWEECLIRIERFWNQPSTIALIDERMKTSLPSSVHHQGKPNLYEPESNSQTVNDILTVDTSEIKEIDQIQNTPESHDAKPEIKLDSQEEKKGVANKQQSSANQSIIQSEIEIEGDIPSTSKLCNNEGTNSQHGNVDSNPKETQEGLIKSLWSFWKSK